MPEVPLESDPAIDPKVEDAVKNETPMPGLEKFWDEESKTYRQEDIQKSYVELQKKFSSKAPEGGDKPDLSIDKGEPEDPKTEEPKDPEVNPEQVVSDAGLDMDALNAEYAETGDLSKDSKQAILEQVKHLGVDEAGLDLYLKAQAEASAGFAKEVYEIVGGEQEYQARLEWAQANLSPDEIQAFNDVVNDSDKEKVKLSVAGLDARYRDAVGSPPKSPVSGRRSSAGGVQPFASQMEATQATMDPRYSTDESYRREVTQRQIETLRLRGK
jgi:hypothetical protein